MLPKSRTFSLYLAIDLAPRGARACGCAPVGMHVALLFLLYRACSGALFIRCEKDCLGLHRCSQHI